MSTTAGEWPATVRLAEHLGSDTFVHAEADGIGPLTIRLEGEAPMTPGQTHLRHPAGGAHASLRQGRQEDRLTRVGVRSEPRCRRQSVICHRASGNEIDERKTFRRRACGPARGVAVPRYDRADLSAGIVHIGVGNFHRAHQAVYLDDLFNAGRDHDWAIVGAGVRDADVTMREKLARAGLADDGRRAGGEGHERPRHRADDRFRQAVRRRGDARRTLSGRKSASSR